MGLTALECGFKKNLLTLKVKITEIKMRRAKLNWSLIALSKPINSSPITLLSDASLLLLAGLFEVNVHFVL